ncbi:MAG: CARDB domain-containing protein, partial [Candidatus Poseidoniaceae archaeon]|nr:CARDB domain-containing protein [Candidatus Poseidoniaceae archaeon]
LSSSWGEYNTTIVAPRIPVADAAVPLPYINVKSISMEDNKGYTNMGLSGDVVVENTGSAAATGVDFWCYVDGVDQDTSQLVTSLAPGETKTIYVTWRTGTVGVQSLECQPLIPTILKPIVDEVTNVDGATSQDVSWTVEEEGESQPWLIFSLVLVVLIAGAWVVSNQAAKAAIEKSAANQQAASEDEKSYLEDDEVEAEEDAETEADGEDDHESEESTNVWDE